MRRSRCRPAAVAALALVTFALTIPGSTPAMAYDGDSGAYMVDDSRREERPGCVWTRSGRDCKDRDLFDRLVSEGSSTGDIQRAVESVLGPFAGVNAKYGMNEDLSEILRALHTVTRREQLCIDFRTLKGITVLHRKSGSDKKMLALLDPFNKALGRASKLSEKQRQEQVTSEDAFKKNSEYVRPNIPDLNYTNPILAFASAQVKAAKLLGTQASKYSLAYEAHVVAFGIIDCYSV